MSAVNREIVGFNDRISTLITTILGWGAAILFFFPVFWMVLTSFKEEQIANQETPVFFFDATLDRYRDVLDNLTGTLTAAKAFSNSFIVVLVSTIIVLLLGIPAAYSLAVKPIQKWRDVLFFFISTKFLPIAAAVLPLFFFARELGIQDTRLVLIIVYTALNLPLAVWMMRSFFAEVPKELIEAAQIDGAPLLSQLRSVILPIVSPGIAATGLLCFIFAWNEYFLALNLTRFDAATVPIWVTTNVNNRGQFLAKLSAAATVASLPVIIAGWVAQKRLVRGLALGAIK